MGFGESIGSVFRNYVNFSGRACRAEYWWFLLFNVIVSLVLVAVDYGVLGFDPTQIGPLRGIYTLGTIIPAIAVAFRRMHDIGRRAWWLLLPIIPIFWFMYRGDKQANAYGPDPLGGRSV